MCLLSRYMCFFVTRMEIAKLKPRNGFLNNSMPGAGSNAMERNQMPTLEELLSLVTDGNCYDIADWGSPRGKEVW